MKRRKLIGIVGALVLSTNVASADSAIELDSMNANAHPDTFSILGDINPNEFTPLNEAEMDATQGEWLWAGVYYGYYRYRNWRLNNYRSYQYYARY